MIETRILIFFKHFSKIYKKGERYKADNRREGRFLTYSYVYVKNKRRKIIPQVVGLPLN